MDHVMAEPVSERTDSPSPAGAPSPPGAAASPDSAEPHFRLEMLSQARFLAAARAMISNLAQRLGFNDIQCGQISLAVDEALCNIINHGYGKRADGRIWMNIWIIESSTPTIKIIIEDRAKQVDPKTIRSRDLDDIRPGGLGVYIIREIMDQVTYEQREGGGMRLTMVKQVPAGNADDSSATRSEDSTTAGDSGGSSKTGTQGQGSDQRPSGKDGTMPATGESEAKR
jgi:serine/threonine-protein kinase RsbW